MIKDQSPPEEGRQGVDKECVSFWDIFQNTWGLLTGNISSVLNYALLSAAAGLISGRLVALFGNENQFTGLMVMFLASFFIFSPVLHMAASRLALRFWDNEEASWADLTYGLINYGDSLFIFLCWLLFGIFLSLLTALCAVPSEIVYVLALGASGSVFFATLAGVGVFAALFATYIWPRARRVLPFLYHIIAFGKINGQSGPWFSRMSATYRAFNDMKFVSSLNQAMSVYLGMNLVVIVPFLVIMNMTGLNNASEMSVTTEVAITLINAVISSFLFLWVATAAAGFYRLNNISAAAGVGNESGR